MTELEHRELSGRVIEAGIAVPTELEPGFVESVDENALGVELTERGLAHEQQRNVPVLYRGKEVGLHRLNLVSEGVLLVELKAAKAIDDDVFFAAGRSQMRAAGLPAGLILNFAAMPLTIKGNGPGISGS